MHEKNNYSLFQQIVDCEICEDVEKGKIVRKFLPDSNVKVMLIAEALAESQMRRSWVPYFGIDGEISPTWKSLEKFLNLMNLTIYPSFPNSIYATEIVHCFPWHEVSANKKKIKRPSQGCIQNCLSHKFLLRELSIINPQIIFLMWSTSYETFYSYLLCQEQILPLTQKISSISDWWDIDFFNEVPLIPIQHASWANPRFSQMLQNDKFISKIKGLINSK